MRDERRFTSLEFRAGRRHKGGNGGRVFYSRSTPRRWPYRRPGRRSRAIASATLFAVSPPASTSGGVGMPSGVPWRGPNRPTCRCRQNRGSAAVQEDQSRQTAMGAAGFEVVDRGTQTLGPAAKGLHHRLDRRRPRAIPAAVAVKLDQIQIQGIVGPQISSGRPR